MTKISDEQLLKMVDKGHSQAKIAKRFCVARSTINRRLSMLKQATTSAVIVNSAVKQRVDGELDPISDLKKLNRVCWDILKEAKTGHEKLAASKEIRDGLKLHFDILTKIYDVEMIQAFQAAVMEALEETSPELRREAVMRINAKREMRGVAIL